MLHNLFDWLFCGLSFIDSSYQKIDSVWKIVILNLVVIFLLSFSPTHQNIVFVSVCFNYICKKGRKYWKEIRKTSKWVPRNDYSDQCRLNVDSLFITSFMLIRFFHPQLSIFYILLICLFLPVLPFFLVILYEWKAQTHYSWLFPVTDAHQRVVFLFVIADFSISLIPTPKVTLFWFELCHLAPPSQ